jgi:hypothetical protein
MTAPGLPKFCQKGLQVGDSLIDAPSFMLGKVETMYETQAVSRVVCAFLILCSHVLALPDDNATASMLRYRFSHSEGPDSTTGC